MAEGRGRGGKGAAQRYAGGSSSSAMRVADDQAGRGPPAGRVLAKTEEKFGQRALRVDCRLDRK